MPDEPIGKLMQGREKRRRGGCDFLCGQLGFDQVRRTFLAERGYAGLFYFQVE